MVDAAELKAYINRIVDDMDKAQLAAMEKAQMCIRDSDVPVNQHFPGIRAEVAGAKLVHLVANHAQFLLIQADFFADGYSLRYNN